MDGIDGMETARKLRSQNDKGYLIFITVLKEMVFQSFEVQAYDYLIKPINEECFEKTMGRLYASMQNANDAKVLYEDPKKVPKTKDVKAEEKPAKKAEKCTTNTDNVDREIERLKEDKKQLEQQIKVAAGDEEKMKELEKKLAQIEGE